MLALATSPNLFTVLQNAPRGELLYCYLCGAMWGVGGLTWGLMIRYLGVGLGLALGCGITSAAGTLVPRLLAGDIGRLFEPGAGIVSFLGVVVSLAGIVTVGLAGMSKERELPEAEKKKSVAEFNFAKGIRIGALLRPHEFRDGLGAGWRADASSRWPRQTAPFTSRTWSGMPVLVVVLLGGLTVNLAWCLFLNVRNKTTGDYLKGGAPLAGNFVFAAIAGAIWCSQFICFKTGEPAMGQTAYVGWALLMACQILFSSLIGAFFLGEWRATGRRTRMLLAVGLGLLILTAVLSGFSGYLALA